MEPSCKRLIGRRAIVTGGAAGIGRAIAIRLAQEGADVTIADVQATRGIELVDQITASNGTASFIETDVASEESVASLVDEVIEATGRVEALVNNAGIPGASQAVHETEAADFDRVIAVNLRGMFLVARQVLPSMISAKRGAIVNIASTFGMVGAPRSAAYAASKGGVIALTRQMAVEYGPLGIRVNSVSPGYVDNDMADRRSHMSAEDSAANIAARQQAARLQPLGRQADTSEIAAAVAFLVSDDASFVTGANLTVDGGCTAFFNLGETYSD